MPTKIKPHEKHRWAVLLKLVQSTGTAQQKRLVLLRLDKTIFESLSELTKRSEEETWMLSE